MSNSVIKDVFSISTYESNALNTFTNIAATTVNAYKDENNTHLDLTLGASSNVNIEALDNVRVYFDKDSSLQLFNSMFSNNVRIDTELLDISQSMNNTYIYTSNQPLIISGQDGVHTTQISQTVFTDSNDYQLLQTSQTSGFQLGTQVVLASNLIVDKDIVAYENIALAGNLFAPTMNIYKNTEASVLNNMQNQIAYGFYINEFDQLELIKYNKYTSNLNQFTYNISRVATFGSNIYAKVGNLNNYTVMNQFTGIVGSPSNVSSNNSGSTAGMTAMGWSINADKKRIYYSDSNVGIYTSDPKYALDVVGDISASKRIMSLSNIGAGTLNPRAPLHVEGMSYFNGEMRTTGRFMTTSNMGVGSTNPQAQLHVVGNSIFEGDIIPGGNGIYNLGSSNNRFGTLYISANTIDIGGTLLKRDETDGSITFMDSNGANTNVNTSKVTIANSNVTFLIDIVDDKLYTYQSNASGLTPVSLIQNISISGSNVGINKAVPTKALDVVGDANLTGSMVIGGDLTVMGNTTTVNTENVLIKDNVITLNSSQTGVPASTLKSGLEIERGSLSNYLFIFDESVAQFKVGTSNSLNTLVTHDDTLTSGFTYYNSNTQLLTNRDITLNDFPSLEGSIAYGSNLSRDSSNALYPQASFASNNAVWGSNKSVTDSNALYPKSMYASNVAVWGSNKSVNDSNILYSQALFASNLAVTSSNALYPQASFASNSAVWGSNLAVTSSNELYPQTSFASNLAVTSSNELYPQAIFASNLAVTSSNALYPKATFASNLAAVALTRSSNLSDLTNIATAQNNLGLGTSCNVAFNNINISGDILPTVTLTQNIGSSNLRFNNMWVNDLHLGVNSLYLGDTKILGTTATTVDIKADLDQSVNVNTSGVGHTQISSVAGIDLNATNGSIISSASNGSIQFNTVGTNRSIALTAEGASSRVSIAAGTEIDITSSNTVISGNASVGENLIVGKNLTVTGDVTIMGSNFVANAVTVQVKDNIMLLNYGQTGSGVGSVNGAGIEIDRGDYARYRLVFKESSQMFVMGAAGNEEIIASQNYVGTNALWKASNLAEIVNPQFARNNLGLGASCNVMFNNLTVSDIALGTINSVVFVNGTFGSNAGAFGSNYAVWSSNKAVDASNVAFNTWNYSGSNVYAIGSNVGIGLVNPQYPLHVNGSIVGGNYSSFKGAGASYLTFTGNANGSLMQITPSNSTNQVVTLNISSYSGTSAFTNINLNPTNATLTAWNSSNSASYNYLTVAEPFVYCRCNLSVDGYFKQNGVILALTDSNSIYPVATFASNAGTFGSNTAVWASNNGGTWASNAGAFGSNYAVWSSNKAVDASNAIFPQALFGSNYAVWASNTAVWASNNGGIFASNAGAFGSNYAVWSSNKTVDASNVIFPQALFGSNYAVWASNTAVWASNNGGIFASNAGAFGSNYAVWASNTAVWASNNGGAWASNNTYFASNLAVTASNRAFNTWNYSSSNVYVLGSNVGVGTSTPNTILESAGTFGISRLNVGTGFGIAKVTGGVDTWIKLATTAETQLKGSFYVQGTINYVHSLYKIDALVTMNNAGSDISSQINTQNVYSSDAGTLWGSNFDLVVVTDSVNNNVNLYAKTKASGGNLIVNLNVFANTKNGTGSTKTVFYNDKTYTYGFSNSMASNIDTSLGSTYAEYVVSSSANTKYLSYINTAGNMGLGTVTPAYKLDVVGSIQCTAPGGGLFLNGGADTTYINLSNYIGGSTQIGLANANGNFGSWALSNDFIIRNNASTLTGKIILQSGVGNGALCVNSNNYVGISTSAPAYPLDVAGAIRSITNIGPSPTPNILLANSNTVLNFIAANALTANYNPMSTGAGSLIFFSSNSTLNTGSLVIGPWSGNNWGIKIMGATGYTGINNASPGYPLDVAGDINTNATVRSVTLSNSGGMQVGGNTDISGIANIYGSSRWAVSQGYMTTGSLTLGSSVKNYGGGNVGWNSNTAALLFETTSTTEIAVHHYSSALRSLIYYDGSKYFIGRSMDNGTTAATNVVFSGNVGIGTASPTQKLDVTGNINAAGAILMTNTSTTTTQAMISVAVAAGSYANNATLNDLIVRSQYNNVLLVPSQQTLANATLCACSNGNVGIGTVSPGYKLDVAGDINTSTTLRSVTHSNSGNMQVGGTLVLNGSQLYTTGTSGNFFIDGLNSGTQTIFGYNTPKPTGVGNVGVIQVYNNVSDRSILFCVNTAGSTSGSNGIGIFNGSPIYPLDVAGDIRTTATLRSVTHSNSGNLQSGGVITNNVWPATVGGITLQSLSTNNNWISWNYWNNTAGMVTGNGSTSMYGAGFNFDSINGKLYYRCTTAASINAFNPSTVYPLTIVSSSGYVGINTQSPGYNLDVGGDINTNATLRSVTHSNSGNMQVGGTLLCAGGITGNCSGGTNGLIFTGNMTGNTPYIDTTSAAGVLRMQCGQNGTPGVWGLQVRPTGLVEFNSNISVWHDAAVAGNMQVGGTSYLAGNVGINTSTPSAQLEISGIAQGSSKHMFLSGNSYMNQAPDSASNGILILNGVNATNNRQLWFMDSTAPWSSTVGAFRIGVNATGSPGLSSVSTDGNVQLKTVIANFWSATNFGIGTSNPSVQLDLSTDGARKLTTSTWATGSDRRVKDNIEDANLDMCYSNLKAINLKRFQWNSNLYPEVDDRNTLGWIAQDVQEIYPKAVYESDSFGFSNFLNLNSDIILKTVYGALRKTMNIVESQAITISNLESRITQLETK